jgi:hypothetical protein
MMRTASAMQTVGTINPTAVLELSAHKILIGPNIPRQEKSAGKIPGAPNIDK